MLKKKKKKLESNFWLIHVNKRMSRIIKTKMNSNLNLMEFLPHKNSCNLISSFAFKYFFLGQAIAMQCYFNDYLQKMDEIIWKKKYSPERGIEPLALGLKVQCSTSWAIRADIWKWPNITFILPWLRFVWISVFFSVQSTLCRYAFIECRYLQCIWQSQTQFSVLWIQSSN